MTPQEFAAELSKFIVTPAEAQLNPKRQGLADIATGRAHVAYNNQKVIVCLGIQSARRVRRKLINMVIPKVNLGKVRGKIRDAAYNALLMRIARACQTSEHSADMQKMQDRVLRNERRELNAAERKFQKQAHECVFTAFITYNRVLDRDTILELWDKAVVAHVIES